MDSKDLKKIQEVQILYETAMAIGVSMDLKETLQKSLNVFLTKLNCTAGIVYKVESNPGSPPQAQQIFAIPRRVKNNLNHSLITKYVDSLLDIHQDKWLLALPVRKFTQFGDYVYLVGLQGFGILVLVKNKKPVDDSLWMSLQRVFERLAHACNSCENSLLLQNLLEKSSEEIKQSKWELIMAREKAEEANRAKSRFLSQMTHELRTPMNGVIGMATLLEDSGLNTEQKSMLSVIQSSGKMLLAIINDILDFSKIEAGKLEIEKYPFNLEESLEKCNSYVIEKAKKKGLQLNWNIQKNVPRNLIQDAVRLQQILLNLLSNAIKFTNQGSITVTVDSRLLKNNSHKVVFSVKDTGIGIPEEKIHRLFQSFSQIDASISRKYGGTGLGLSISKQLAELLDGNIWVDSEEGEGSTFYFSIIAIENLPKSDKEKSLISHKHFDEKIAEKYPLKILLAEDNLVNQKVATGIIKKLGYRIDIANNGKEVIGAFENRDYDLIFMDINMPEMDGVEATKMLRSRPTAEKQPYIIALTANTFQDDIESYIEAGMNDHIKKPIDIIELQAAMLKAIEDQYDKDFSHL